MSASSLASAFTVFRASEHTTGGHAYFELQPLKKKTFFSKYLLRPCSDDLVRRDKVIAIIASIAIGIFTLGLFHLFVYLCCYDPNCGLPRPLLRGSARTTGAVAGAPSAVGQATIGATGASNGKADYDTELKKLTNAVPGPRRPGVRF